MQTTFSDGSFLTTEHEASSYDRPVYVRDGQAYGPEDSVMVAGSPEPASAIVWNLATEDGEQKNRLVELFCRSFPPG